MRDADRERWVTSKEAICQIIETIYSYINYVFTTNIPIAHDIFASLFLRTTLLPLRTSKCRKMLQKANERNVIIKNTFYWNDYVQAAPTQSFSLSRLPSTSHSHSVARSLSLLCATLTLANVAYEQFRCVRISTSSASGECDTTGHSIYAKYKNTYIHIYVCLYVLVCLCVWSRPFVPTAA